MNLKQLLFVQLVAETHSFSKAAEICHATQPTLSNAISQFEAELGGKLFLRTTRKVDLTSFGEYMLPLIRALLDDKSELEKSAHAYFNPEHILIRIGLSPLIDMKLLNRVLMPYRQAHPDVSIFFKECLLDDLGQRINNEQIDFAVIPARQQEAGRATCFFYEEPLYYLPQEVGSACIDCRQVTVSELPKTEVILTGGGCGLNDALDELFQQENSDLLRYPGQALSYKVIEEWASLGIGAGILPQAKISSDNKVSCPLLLNNGMPATFSYEWVWNVRRSMQQDIAEFIEYLTTSVPAIVKGETVAVVA